MTDRTARSEDNALLRRFADRQDEDAFRALVDKYAGVVYGVALRRTGKNEAAEEIAQNVFLALARKAGSIAGRRALGGWIHRAATLESLKHLRNDATHQRHLAMIRDQQQEQQSTGDENLWKEIRPHLDELLNRLSTSEREILVEHYIEGQQFGEIASHIGISAAAAQKRSVRALEKLARFLTRRSVSVSSAFLGFGLAAELGHAAPAGFSGKIGSFVLASSTASTMATSFTSILTIMSTSKIAFAVAFLIAASVPVGMRLSESRASPTLNPTVSTAPVADPATADAGMRDPFDVERFRRSLERLQSDEPLNGFQSRRLQRLMFTLGPGEIREAIAVLDEFEEPERLRDIMGAAYARWAELDPENAVADAHSRPKDRWGYYPISNAWLTWAFSDWDAARVWNATSNDSFSFWSYIDWQAELDGELAVRRAAEIGEDFPAKADYFLSRAAGKWTEHEPDRAIAWMDEHLTDPVTRDDVIGSSMQQLGESDPQKALENMALIDNPERLREVRYNIFWAWSLLQPREAGTYFDESGGGESWNPNTVRSAGEAIARNDPVRALEIARNIEDPERSDSFYCGILCGATQSDLSLVREAAELEAGREAGRGVRPEQRQGDEALGCDHQALLLALTRDLAEPGLEQGRDLAQLLGGGGALQPGQRAPERLGQRDRARVALVAFFFEAAHDEPARFGRDPPLPDDARAGAGEQAIERGAQGVDVGLPVDRVGVVPLLGRHVVVGPAAGAGLGERERAFEREGEPEIAELDPPVRGSQQVARLHVAVHNAMGVRERERFGHLQRDDQGAPDRERAVLLDHGLEVRAVDVLEHERHVSVVAADDLDQGHDPRVVEARDRLTWKYSPPVRSAMSRKSSGLIGKLPRSHTGRPKISVPCCTRASSARPMRIV